MAKNPIGLKGKDLVTDQETLHPIQDFQSSVAEESAQANIALTANNESPAQVPQTIDTQGLYNLTYKLTAKAVFANPATPQHELRSEIRLYKNGAFIGVLQRFDRIFHWNILEVGYSMPIQADAGDVLDIRLVASQNVTFENVQQTFYLHKT